MLRRLLSVVLIFGLAGCTGSNPEAATCQFTNDGECDDGRVGAHTNQCPSGTDEADCADVDPNVCQTNNDGECDDGRPGADFDLCMLGTDEADCGPVPEE